jgi:hypothetical protein
MATDNDKGNLEERWLKYVPEGMEHSDFVIGKTFICGGRTFRCTDVGTRTIAAICLDDTTIVTSSLDPTVEPKTRTLSRAEAEADGWFHGPPYAVNESVFDEYDFGGCSPDHDTAVAYGTAPAGRTIGGPDTPSTTTPANRPSGFSGSDVQEVEAGSTTVGPTPKRGDHPSPGAALPSDQDGSVHQ